MKKRGKKNWQIRNCGRKKKRTEEKSIYEEAVKGFESVNCTWIDSCAPTHVGCAKLYSMLTRKW